MYIGDNVHWFYLRIYMVVESYRSSLLIASNFQLHRKQD